MRYRLGAALFVVVIGAIGDSSLAGATSRDIQWVSSESQPVVIDSLIVPEPPTDQCATFEQDVHIIGVGSRRACLFDGRIKVVSYIEASGRRFAASKTADGALYPIKGICEAGFSCYYGAEQDVLLVREQTGPLSFSATIRQHFSRHINWSIDPSTLQGVYQFDYQLPDYILRNTEGGVVSVGSVALSRNGAWAIVELRDRGTAVINTSDFSARRIIAPGYTYGNGFDPIQQLAISNNGLTGVVTGLNSGFTIVSISPECGEVIEAIMERNFKPSTEECPQSSGGIGDHISFFRRAYSPAFSSDGNRLTVVITSNSAPYQHFSFQPSGMASRERLDYVALGDSFTSGEGESDDTFYHIGTNTSEERCHLSHRSYPYLLGSLNLMSESKTKSVACSGARIRDIVSSAPVYFGQGDRLKGKDVILRQTEAIDQFLPGRVTQEKFIERYQPHVVTIGVGGNDSGFMDKLKTCAMSGLCEWAEPAMLFATADEIARLYEPLVAMYTSLHQAAPQAKLYAVGYPLAVDDIGQCDRVTGAMLEEGERRYMNEAIRYINRVISAAAATSGVRYMNIESAFLGHQLCGAGHPSAMNGFRFGTEAGIFSSLPVLNFIGSETFHPTPYGHNMIADHLFREIPNIGTAACECSAQPVPLPSEYWQRRPGSDTRYYRNVSNMVPDTQKSRHIAVNLPERSFKSHTEVKIELHSLAIELGRTIVKEDGSLSIEVTVPEDVEAGYHMVHVVGEDVRDMPVAYYQALRYELDIEKSVSFLGISEDSPVPIVASTILVPDSPNSVSTPSGQVLSDGVAQNIFLGEPYEPKEETSKTSGYLRDSLLVWGSIGIMAICLILVLLLRNSSLRNYLKRLSRRVIFWKRSP